MSPWSESTRLGPRTVRDGTIRGYKWQISAVFASDKRPMAPWDMHPIIVVNNAGTGPNALTLLASVSAAPV